MQSLGGKGDCGAAVELCAYNETSNTSMTVRVVDGIVNVSGREARWLRR